MEWNDLPKEIKEKVLCESLTPKNCMIIKEILGKDIINLYHKHLNKKEIKISEKTFNNFKTKEIDYEVKETFYTISKRELNS